MITIKEASKIEQRPCELIPRKPLCADMVLAKRILREDTSNHS